MFAWPDGDLDPEQESAIRNDGNVFLIACPGSGKTRTLTYKIAFELSRLKSNKRRVIAITYTHRAADEIQERIESMGVDISQLWIGTIHSFCLEWILKPYGIYHPNLQNGFRVINTHDTELLLTALCEKYQGQGVTFWDCGFYFTKDEFVLSSLDTRKHQTIRAIIDEYLKILGDSRQIDFELMLRYAHDLIMANPSICVLLGKMFAFMLVDEYQDTKAIQYEIIASILKASGGDTKAFIVGDPNQSIFQSLGGFPIPANEFAQKASIDLVELQLWKNYRSSDKIVGYFSNFNVHATRIESASEHRDYSSTISFNASVHRDNLVDELIKLIRYNIETLGIAQEEICILAPWWVSLAGMTRQLVSSLPEYEFDGPGMVPFARDPDNFWYKLSKIALTHASPGMYVRRRRWAGEILKDLEDAGVRVTRCDSKGFLRECNSVVIQEEDGLKYLECFFDELFSKLGVDFHAITVLAEHHKAFFDSAHSRIRRLKSDGADFIGDITTFRKVFENRRGITISTIHGIKGDEYDSVIAYALLEGMVPHFSEVNGAESAMKMLYVIGSRARKNLHLISEKGRPRGRRGDYLPTEKLLEYAFVYDDVPQQPEINNPVFHSGLASSNP